MFYITGDTHGDFKGVILMGERLGLTSEDTVIILGDAGINYYGFPRDMRLKKKLSKLPYTIFSIHGNHEQRPETINTYKEVMWHGGIVYREEDYPNLLFAKDGEVYDLDGKKTLVIGGAYSVDKFYRLKMGYHWFMDEQPSDEIKARVEKKIEEIGHQVDVVLSHTVPFQYEPREVFLSMVNQDTVDTTTEKWLSEIESGLSYDRWYAGHFHTDKTVDRLRLMFSDFDLFGE